MIPFALARARLAAASPGRLAARAGATVAALAGASAGAIATTLPPVVIPPGSAAITSPAVVSQPGATRRFFRATADRAGIWALGTGGNVTDFAIDAVTGIYSIKASAVGDGTAQIVKTVPLVFTPADGSGVATQTVSVTLAPAAAPAQMSALYTGTFAGTAGLRLDQLAGWATNDGQPFTSVILDGNGSLAQGTNKNDAQVCVRQVPALGNLIFTYRIAKGDGIMGLCAATDGNGNQIEVTLKSVGNVVVIPDGNAVWLTQGGTRYQQQVGDISAPFDADKGYVDFQVKFSADGKTVTLGFPSTGKTWSYTGNLTLGKGFGFCFNPYVGWPISGGAKVTQVSSIIQAAALNVTSAPLASYGNAATWGLAWNTALARPTAVQHSYDGSTWFTGDSQIGSDGTITYVGTAPAAGILTPTFRALNDTLATAKAPNATAFLYAGKKFTHGFNLHPGSYFQPIVMLNDWGKYCQLDGGSIFIPYKGINTKPGYVDTVTTNIGVTLFKVDSAVDILSTNPDTGTHTIRVNADSPAGTNKIIGVSGTAATRFTVQRGGFTGKIAPEWINGVEGPYIRDLDMTMSNDVPIFGRLLNIKTVDDYNYMKNGGGPWLVPSEDIIDGIAAKMAIDPTFKGWWHVGRIDETDADHLRVATYARDHLDPRTEIALEHVNETFNPQFASTIRLQLEGIQKGYWGDATAASPKPAKTFVGFGSNSSSNTDGVAAQQGDWMFYNVIGVGFMVYEARKTLAAGTTVGDNDNWLKRTDIDPGLAAKRWHSVRFDQIIEIWRGVFGEARFQSQIKPLVMGWKDQGNLVEYLAPNISFVPGYWAKIKGTGASWYLNAEPSYNENPMTVAGMDASFRRQLPIIWKDVTAIALDAIKLGKDVWMYEGGTDPNQMPDKGGQTWFDYMASDTGYAFMRDSVQLTKAFGIGVWMHYAYAAAQPWQLIADWDDKQNKRYLGYKAGIAA